MRRVLLRAPARLHFGLLDLNGDLGRVDGGVGLALTHPSTLIVAEPMEGIQASVAMEPAFQDRLEAALQAVCDHYAFPGVRLVVQERARPHAGLGSATQTLVGAGLAVAALYNKRPSAREVAGLVGRGGTSGIGIGAIEQGGFLLDGGHRFRTGPGAKPGYSPSSASLGTPPPPILFRCDFPDWDVLVVIPAGEGASGDRERDLFEEACPVPAAEVAHMARILLVQMLPALLERDLAGFGAAMENYQRLGFKVFELHTQGPLVLECMEFLRANGGVGVGMSSWGPAVYAFGHDLRPLRSRAESWLAAHGGGEAFLTRANNQGCHITVQA